MTEHFQDALRAWKASPTDPAIYTRLIRLSKRFQQKLPELLDSKFQLTKLIVKLNNAYQRMNMSGYDHMAAGCFSYLQPPYEFDALRDEITLLTDPYNETDSDYTLPYPCLKVEGVNPIEKLSFPSIGYSPERLPERLVAPFQELEEQRKQIHKHFLDAQYFSVFASYPDDGEVYWDITNVIYLPAHEETFVLAIQHYW